MPRNAQNCVVSVLMLLALSVARSHADEIKRVDEIELVHIGPQDSIVPNVWLVRFSGVYLPQVIEQHETRNLNVLVILSERDFAKALDLTLHAKCNGVISGRHELQIKVDYATVCERLRSKEACSFLTSIAKLPDIASNRFKLGMVSDLMYSCSEQR
jgi:hypothetical protein